MSYSENECVYCVEYFYAKPGCHEQLIACLLKLVEPTRAENGCLQYELIQDKNEPRLVIILVKFANAELMQLHDQQIYVKQFTENEMPTYCEKFSWNEGRLII